MMFDDVRSAFWFPILFYVVFSDAMFHWRISTAGPMVALDSGPRRYENCLDFLDQWEKNSQGLQMRRLASWTTLVQVDSSKVRRMHLWWSDHVLYPSKHGLLVNPPLMRGLLPLKPPCIRDFPLPRLMTRNQFVIIPYTSLNIFIDQNDSHQP